MAPRDRSDDDDDDDDLKSKKNYFKRMLPGFKKKAKELSVLCDNSVGFVCYGPEKDDLHAWPEPQENPQSQSESLRDIVGKFNSMSDQMRMSKACDLFDFPSLKGSSSDELRKHLVKLDSHLLGIEIKKRSVGNSKKRKEEEEEYDDDDHLIRVSDCELDSLGDLLGCELDSLGGLFGFEELVLGFCAASVFTISDSSLLDPIVLGSVF